MQRYPVPSEETPLRKTRKIDPRKIDLRQVEETARKRFEKFVHERELPAITPLTQRQT